MQGIEEFDLVDWLNGRRFVNVGVRLDIYTPALPSWGKNQKRSFAITGSRTAKRDKVNLEHFSKEVYPDIADKLDKEQLFEIYKLTKNMDALQRSGYQLWRAGDREAWLLKGDPKEAEAIALGATVVEPSPIEP